MNIEIINLFSHGNNSWSDSYTIERFQKEFGFPFTSDGWYTNKSDTILAYRVDMSNYIDKHNPNCIEVVVWNDTDALVNARELARMILKIPIVR